MSPPRDGESPPEDPAGDDESRSGGERSTGSDPARGPSPHEGTGPRAADDEPEPLTPTSRQPDSSSDEAPSLRQRASSSEANRAGEDHVAPNGGAGSLDGGPHRRATADDPAEGGTLRTFVFDVVSSAVAVLLVGLLLFAVSGVWPPMVAIESPSMTPHMKTGDLVFVMEEERFPGDGAVAGTGVVTAQAGTSTDYRQFEQTGDVIVYNPNGDTGRTPIIHRAMFWVEEGENWYEKADRQSVGRYSKCGETTDDAMPNCPAPYDGFITKGDANGVYDQIQGLSGPVKPAWVVGTAEVRIPKLGCIRLRTKGCAGGVRGAVCDFNDTGACMAGERRTLAR